MKREPWEKAKVERVHSTHDELLRVALEHAKQPLKAHLERLTANPKWTEAEY